MLNGSSFFEKFISRERKLQLSYFLPNEDYLKNLLYLRPLMSYRFFIRLIRLNLVSNFLSNVRLDKSVINRQS